MAKDGGASGDDDFFEQDGTASQLGGGEKESSLLASALLAHTAKRSSDDDDDAVSTAPSTVASTKAKANPAEATFKCTLCWKNKPLSEMVSNTNRDRQCKRAYDVLAWAGTHQGEEALKWWNEVKIEPKKLRKAIAYILSTMPPGTSIGPGRKKKGAPGFVVAQYVESLKTVQGEEGRNRSKFMWEELSLPALHPRIVFVIVFFIFFHILLHRLLYVVMLTRQSHPWVSSLTGVSSSSSSPKLSYSIIVFVILATYLELSFSSSFIIFFQTAWSAWPFSRDSHSWNHPLTAPLVPMTMEPSCSS
jgi:hypothetical protein